MQQAVARPTRRTYTSRIIKASALVPDTLVLLHHWDPQTDAATNIARVRQLNLLGKGTRSRVDDVLPILQRRYTADPQVIGALSAWLRVAGDGPALRRLLYFHAALADPLIEDVVVEVLDPLRASGHQTIASMDLMDVLRRWVSEGRTSAPWRETTLRRVTEGLLATFRDFGLLEGVVHKRFAPFSLPVPSAAYVAFWLYAGQPSGQRVLTDPRWRIFFLEPPDVELLLLEAHRDGYLGYHAAGSVVRLDFPAADLEVYARATAERAAAHVGG